MCPTGRGCQAGPPIPFLRSVRQEPMAPWHVGEIAGRPLPPPCARPVIQGVVENGYALVYFGSRPSRGHAEQRMDWLGPAPNNCPIGQVHSTPLKASMRERRRFIKPLY